VPEGESNWKEGVYELQSAGTPFTQITILDLSTAEDVTPSMFEGMAVLFPNVHELVAGSSYELNIEHRGS